MKTINLLIGLIFLSSTFLFSQTTDVKVDKFKVMGSCGMCEKRIEKTAQKIEGVTKADWDSKTNMLEISYIPTKVKLIDIQKELAKVGHDNDGAKADDKVYNALPGCCKYERMK